MIKTIQLFPARCGLLVVLGLTVTIWAKAQIIDTIEVNARTGQAKVRIPFDRAFILKVPHPEEPMFVDYVTHRKSRRFQDVIRTKTPIHTLPQAHVKYEKQGGKGFVFLRFDQHPYRDDPSGKTYDLIAPGQNLVLMFPTVDPRGYDVLRLQQGGDNAGATALLAAIEADQKADYRLPYVLPEAAHLPALAQDANAELNTIRVKEGQITVNSNTAFDLRKNASVDALVKFALTDTMIGGRVCASDCELIRSLLALRELDASAFAMLMTGSRSILSNELKTKHADRMANLKGTDEMLARIVTLQRAAEVVEGATAADQQIPALYALVRSNRTLYAEIEESKAAITRNMRNKRGLAFVKITQFDASTTYFSMASRAGFRAIPDFGLIVYGLQKDFIRPAPYLGVQLNFRQVDKDIPLHQYPKHRFIHRLSLGLGYTLMSLAEEGKRGDFFEKGAFMTGLGFRLSNALRLTSGTMWFYKNDPNPLLDGRSLAFVPYFGLSVDLDLRNLVNAFDKLTFSQP